MIAVSMMKIHFHFWNADGVNSTFQLKGSLFQEGCKLSILIQHFLYTTVGHSGMTVKEEVYNYNEHLLYDFCLVAGIV